MPLIGNSEELIKILSEIVGDYTMAGSRRNDAPGNIRAGRFVKGYRGNVLYDEDQTASSIPSAAVIVIKNAGKFLAISRPNNGLDMNLPGGTVEPGETAESAARRELLEETGLTVEKLEKIFAGSNRGTYVTVFKGHGVSGNIRSTPEGIVRWADEDLLRTGTYGRFFERMLRSIRL